MSYSIPHLHVTGTNYQVGLAIVISISWNFAFLDLTRLFFFTRIVFTLQKGREFQHRIKTYFNAYEDLNKKLLPFAKSEKGAKVNFKK